MEVSEAGLQRGMHFCPILTNFFTAVLPGAVMHLGIAAEHEDKESLSTAQVEDNNSQP